MLSEFATGWQSSINRLSFFAALLFTAQLSFAQLTLNSTVGTTGYTNGNSSGSNSFVTFVVQNNSGGAIILTDVGRYVSTAYNGTVSEIWYSSTSLSGTVALAAPTWTMISQATLAGITTSGGVVNVNSNLNFFMPQGAIYRFAAYTTGTNAYSGTGVGSCTPNTLTSNGVSLIMGDYQIAGAYVGYAATNNPRFFTGSITWMPVASAPNNAGVQSIDSPYVFCSGAQNVVATIRNFGNNAIDSVDVNWSVNGVVQTPLHYTMPIDTFSASGNYTAQVTLGSFSFPSTLSELKVWTSLPNGIVDTANGNDTMVTYVQPSLYGNYIIGGSNPDFPTFTDAVNALNSFGVCSAVTFLVADGVYNEQISIGDVVGASATNTITFTSVSGNTSNCQLQFAGTTANNYVVKLNGSSFVTMNNIGFNNTSTTSQRVLEMAGTSHDNTFDGCLFVTPNTTTSSNLRAVIYASSSGLSNNTVKNSQITGGSYGVYHYGSSTTARANGFLFQNNAVTGWNNYGFYGYYNSNMKIIGNTFVSGQASTTTTTYGLYIWYSNNGSEISYNKVTPNAIGAPNYASYMGYLEGSLTNPAKFDNNVLVAGLPTTTLTTYAAYCSSFGFAIFEHNNIIAQGTSASSRGLYLTSGAYNKLYNNNIITTGPSGISAYYTPSYVVLESENNNMYTAGNIFGYLGANVTTFSDWQALGLDINSKNVNPTFQSDWTKTCDVELNNAGRPTSVSVDLEGDMRSATTPDIGADEFGLLSNIIAEESLNLCPGATATISANLLTGDTIIWMTTDTTSSYTVNQIGQVTVYGFNNCSQSYDTLMVINPATVSLQADTIICEGATITVGSNIQGTYNWSNGATTAAIDVNTAGTYAVTVVDAYGCVSNDQMLVSVSQGATLPEDTTFCDGSSIFLDCGVTSASYQWSNGLPNAQIVSVNTSGLYAVTVTDTYGCISTDAVDVLVVPQPDANFTLSQSYFTAVADVVNPYNGTTYAWDFGDGTSLNGPNVYHIYSTPGIYTITLNASNQCGTSNSTFEFNTEPESVVELSNEIGLTAYPNPASNQVAIATNQANGIYSMQLVDASGRVVLSENIQLSATPSVVSLATITAGVYILKLSNETTVSQTKLIVQ